VLLASVLLSVRQGLTVSKELGLTTLLHPPPHCEPALVDSVLPVRTDDAKDMARRIARKEALFAGTSSGANLVAAIQVPRFKCGRLGPDAKVITLMADSGLKYLSTDVYRSR
jgi:cysteine synthase A